MLNLSSRLRRDLLGYYFTNPSASHYLRELAGILNADPANLSRELRRLEHEGLFTSDRRGNQKHFRLNRHYPLYDEIRGIVAKTIGATGKLKAALARVEGIEEALLYGSFARNQQDQASDIDLLIIGKPEMGDLEEALRTLERQLRREINYTLLTREELESRLKKKDPFITDVWENKRIDLLAPLDLNFTQRHGEIRQNGIKTGGDKMKHKKLSFCLALLASLAFAGVFRVANSSTQGVQSADAMLGAALHLEEVEGNLEAAIDAYKRFLAQCGGNESLAAKAQLHIGICYEKLGLRKARIAYQTVIDNYPQQQEAVKAAKERISRLAGASESHSDKPRFRKMHIPVKLFWQSPTPNGPIIGFGARLSPDGETLAFDSEGSIWVIPVQGNVSSDLAGEPRRLTEAMYAYAAGFSWSADGNWISFNASREDGGKIWVVSVDGGGPIEVETGLDASLRHIMRSYQSRPLAYLRVMAA